MPTLWHSKRYSPETPETLKAIMARNLRREAKHVEDQVGDLQGDGKAIREHRIEKYDESEGQPEYVTWGSGNLGKPSFNLSLSSATDNSGSLRRGISNLPVQKRKRPQPAMQFHSTAFSVPPMSRYEYEPPKQRHDPGKLAERRADGRVNLKGVRANSHVSLYERDFQPHTMKSFEARKAFKVQLLRNASSPATRTWGAVNSWYSSNKDFDDFVKHAKEGERFHEHRNQNIGGQFTELPSDMR